jgi:hypothetical protein
MSRKKYTDKAELFLELKEHLEEMYNQVESAEVRFNHLEHQDYVAMVVNPFTDLIELVGIFATNLDNGIYDSDSGEEVDGENFGD